FREYITQTQKMRAYKGKIESHSPLAPKSAPPPEKKKPAPVAAPVARPPAPSPVANPTSPAIPAAGPRSNLLAVAAILVLAVAAVGLTIALLVK
ncbi:MAG TPA: hypothetical protein VN878_03945, partial [Usitatibacter sp.]|nr:hypothetical protein [Usitatibacter sp.]